MRKLIQTIIKDWDGNRHVTDFVRNGKTTLITRAVLFDNKLVDRELERFTSRIEKRETALYIRKKT